LDALNTAKAHIASILNGLNHACDDPFFFFV